PAWLNKRRSVSSKAKIGPAPVHKEIPMPKVLAAALLVVGLLAWGAVAPAALPQDDGSALVGARMQWAHGGGGGHAAVSARAREKAAAKNEEKKETAAINQPKKSGSDEAGDDADDAADKDDAESGLGSASAHHSH